MLAPHKTYERGLPLHSSTKGSTECSVGRSNEAALCDGEAANVLQWAAPTGREQVPAGATTAALAQDHPDSYFTLWRTDFMFFSLALHVILIKNNNSVRFQWGILQCLLLFNMKAMDRVMHGLANRQRADCNHWSLCKGKRSVHSALQRSLGQLCTTTIPWERSCWGGSRCCPAPMLSPGWSPSPSTGPLPFLWLPFVSVRFIKHHVTHSACDKYKSI